jgi:hypothetical protein
MEDLPPVFGDEDILPGASISKKPVVPVELKQALQTDERYGIGLSKLLDSKTVDMCHFDFIHSFVPVEKKSASDSSVFFGELNSPSKPPPGFSTNTVAVKAFLRPYEYQSNALLIERINYQIIANNIIAQRWSPNVIAYVGSFGCNLDVHPSDSIKAKKLNFIKWITTNIKDKPTAKRIYQDLKDSSLIATAQSIEFLVTEKIPKSKTLFDYLWGLAGDVEITEEEIITKLMSIIFQLTYTLEVFRRIGFRHNDAHLGNIFVGDYTDVPGFPDTLTYNVDGTLFKIPVKSTFIKFFDFDRSTFSCDPATIHPDYRWLQNEYLRAIDRNKLAEFQPEPQPIVGRVPFKDRSDPKRCYQTGLLPSKLLCKKYGQCNSVNDKYDLNLTFNGLISHPAMTYIAPAIKDYFRENYFSGSKKYAVSDDEISWMSPAKGVPKDSEIARPMMILNNHEMFQEFIDAPTATADYSLPLDV